MDLSTYLFLCPMLFLAGFVDAVGGGGGLISLPAYFMAGLPAHTAIATNKLSGCCGTAVVTYRFFKDGCIKLKLAIGAIIGALIGSFLGANLSLRIDEEIVTYLFYIILPICAFIVFNKNCLQDEDKDFILTKKVYVIICVCSFFIGIYDGFYGPGTGTFLLIAFSIFVKMSLKFSNGLAKIINLSSSLMSLAVFILNGEVIFTLGIVCAICNMLGGYIGANMAIKQGSKIVRPVILVVLGLLFVKIL